MPAASLLPYPDTSFLIALHGDDAFTDAARAEVLKLGVSLVITDLNELEYRNALRLLNFRKLITGRQLTARLASFQKDRDAGRLIYLETEWQKAWRAAEMLSGKHTASEGHRLIDLLHVVVAQSLGSKRFLSFDDRQRSLAKRQDFALNALT